MLVPGLVNFSSRASQFQQEGWLISASELVDFSLTGEDWLISVRRLEALISVPWLVRRVGQFQHQGWLISVLQFQGWSISDSRLVNFSLISG